MPFRGWRHCRVVTTSDTRQSHFSHGQLVVSVVLVSRCHRSFVATTPCVIIPIRTKRLQISSLASHRWYFPERLCERSRGMRKGGVQIPHIIRHRFRLEPPPNVPSPGISLPQIRYSGFVYDHLMPTWFRLVEVFFLLF